MMEFFRLFKHRIYKAIQILGNYSSSQQKFWRTNILCLRSNLPYFRYFLYHFVSHTKNAVRCEEKHAKLRLNFFFAVSLCLFSSVSLRFALKQSEACSFCIVYSTRDFQLFFILKKWFCEFYLVFAKIFAKNVRPHSQGLRWHNVSMVIN